MWQVRWYLFIVSCVCREREVATNRKRREYESTKQRKGEKTRRRRRNSEGEEEGTRDCCWRWKWLLKTTILKLLTKFSLNSALLLYATRMNGICMGQIPMQRVKKPTQIVFCGGKRSSKKTLAKGYSEKWSQQKPRWKLTKSGICVQLSVHHKSQADIESVFAWDCQSPAKYMEFARVHSPR